jgi:predicted metalloprotease
MRWQMAGGVNVEDRRGGYGATRGGMVPRSGGDLDPSYLTGQNPLDLLQQVDNAPVTNRVPESAPPGHDTERDFVASVLGSTEDSWTQIFAASGRQYEPPKLVLFTDAVRSACGLNSAAVGPFYCPPDQKVYLDLSFFRALDRRFGAPGDFAQAYVIAHEVGHHVQNLLGTAERINQMRGRLSEAEANALSVRQELQADCFAGVWGHQAQNLLQEGDVDEGLRAAQGWRRYAAEARPGICQSSLSPTGLPNREPDG